MNTLPARREPPAEDELHPLVYKAMFGLTVWLVLSVWVLFGRGAYVGLIITMITVFFVIVTGIPVLIWLTWRRQAAHPEHDDESFRTWAAHRFKTWSGGLPGSAAAAQILLPLAAVAIGMTVFGLVYDLTIPHLT
jgi:hypothetical protein